MRRYRISTPAAILAAGATSAVAWVDDGSGDNDWTDGDRELLTTLREETVAFRRPVALVPGNRTAVPAPSSSSPRPAAAGTYAGR